MREDPSPIPDGVQTALHGLPGAAVLLAVLMLLAGGGSAAANATPLQQGLSGPAEGESIAQWTARWMEGPVQVIATREERQMYASLSTIQERLQFIRLFWQRRDPRVRGPRNEFLDEFTRRLAYAEEHFSNSREPAWKTVFGQVVLLFGPPDRTRREIAGFPRGFSDRPPILWSYDERFPGIEPNEDLLFAFRAGHWRLMPPYPIGDGGLPEIARQAERQTNVGSPIPSDYQRAMDQLITASLVNPVNYRSAIKQVRTAVQLPDAQIPFGYTLHFQPASDGRVKVDIDLTWRMDSLIFHLLDGNFRTDMVIDVQLQSDGQVRFAASAPVEVSVPESEMQARRGEGVRRTVSLEAAPGNYELELVLLDQLLGYRTVYRESIEVRTP